MYGACTEDQEVEEMGRTNGIDPQEVLSEYFVPSLSLVVLGSRVGIHDSVWLTLLFLEISLFFKFTIFISFLQTPDEKGSQQRSKEVTKDDNALLYSIDETPPLYLSFLLGFQVGGVHLSYTIF